MIRLRNPKRDDTVIWRLIREELLPYTRQIMPEVQVNRKEIVARLDRNATFVARGGRRRKVGFVTVLRHGEKLFIDMLAVDRASQGQGWGTALMRAAERYGSRRGCRTAALYVDRANRNALRFYAKLGYGVRSFWPSLQCYTLEKSL